MLGPGLRTASVQSGWLSQPGRGVDITVGSFPQAARRTLRAIGVTAEFNRNVLCVPNWEPGADFDPGDFDHVALERRRGAVEMWLPARRELRVDMAGLELKVSFDAGEQIRTEILAKFRLDRVRDKRAVAGLITVHSWTDPVGDFALTLAGLGR